MHYGILFVAIIATSIAHLINYNNYRVVRMIPKTLEQLKQIKTLENNELNLNFWKDPSKIGSPVDVMISPKQLLYLENFAQFNNIDTILLIDNIQNVINETTNHQQQKRDGKFGWQSYHSFEEISDWMIEMENKYPNIVKVINIGKSYEQRNILGFQIEFRPENNVIVLEGGIHGREWISPATVTYIINAILTMDDQRIRTILENYNWYIFPVMNPDGYEYSRLSDRFWRKSRKFFTKVCSGVDLNRNWNFSWKNNENVCSSTYEGPYPFSEPEIKSLANFINLISDKLVAYISFHSYSQFLLIPYGHTKTPLDNFFELLEIGKKAATSLFKRYGTKYIVGNTVAVIYNATGVSMDWVKYTYKTPITYTFELRDKGKYGFLLPPRFIIPTGKETMDALVTILEESKKLGY